MKYNSAPSGTFGDGAGGGGDNHSNFPISLRVPFVSADQANQLLEIQQSSNVIINYLQQQPICFVKRLNKVLDFVTGLPKETKCALVADPTESFGPRSVDVGARLPGGIGSAPWISQYFRYHRSMWDVFIVLGFAFMGGSSA